MKLVSLIIVACLGLYQATPSLQQEFDGKKAISNAAEVLVDHCAEHGSDGVEPVLYKSAFTPLIRDFCSGLMVFKGSAGSGYPEARKGFVFKEYGPEKQDELAKNSQVLDFVERYLSKIRSQDTRSDIVRYLEASKATKVVEMIISLPKGQTIHWFLFFRTENKKWRLDQALPYFENIDALRGVFTTNIIDLLRSTTYYIRVRGSL